jgi:hypothetical protein
MVLFENPISGEGRGRGEMKEDSIGFLVRSWLKPGSLWLD